MSTSTLYWRSHRYLKNAEEVAKAKADEISESDRPDLEEIESKQGEAQINLDGAIDKCAATKQTLSSLIEFLWRLRISFFESLARLVDIFSAEIVLYPGGQKKGSQHIKNGRVLRTARHLTKRQCWNLS